MSETLANYCIKIGYGSSIGDGLRVKCIVITGSYHYLSYWGYDAIQIGCKNKTISEWEKQYAQVGNSEHYSQIQIEEYKGYIDMIKGLHSAGTFAPIKINE